MNNHLFSLVFIFFSTFFLCEEIMASTNLARAAVSPDTLPRHTISISFNLENSQLSGTSRINLPKNTPLTLHCGPLIITGSILEQENHTPLQVIADTDNIIKITAARSKADPAAFLDHGS